MCNELVDSLSLRGLATKPKILLCPFYRSRQEKEWRRAFFSCYSATPSHASQRERAFTLNAEQFHFEFWIFSASASSMAQMLARFAGEGSLTFVRSTEELPMSVAFPSLTQPLPKSK